jgi:hypothetical protein
MRKFKIKLFKPNLLIIEIICQYYENGNKRQNTEKNSQVRCNIKNIYWPNKDDKIQLLK